MLQDGKKPQRMIAAKIVASMAMAETECEGLRALKAAGAPVPKCYGAWQDPGPDPVAILFMDFLSAAENASGAQPHRTTIAERLIEDLLTLYNAPVVGHTFGWTASNFIGSLVQPNRPHNSFSAFWWEDRLKAQFHTAHNRGLLSAAVGRELETVFGRCANEWALDRCEPRLVHGDLWNGNLLAGPEGRLYMIDPSVAYSNPEQDLAMLDLFGSCLGSEQLEMIAQAAGIGPGLAERIPFWQLYPLLVHVNIFGKSYVGQVQAALSVYR